MEEESLRGSSANSWVNRFEPVAFADGVKLKLTDETKEKLAWATTAFTETLKQLVNELFCAQKQTCELLVRYTVLQLLSDAGFCVQIWQTKGGGNKDRWRPPSLEKWLWRALWDIWVASYVEATYKDIDWFDDLCPCPPPTLPG